MTLVPTSVTSAELVSLSEQANEGHRRCVESHQKTVTFAKEVGHILLKAYELVPNGEWQHWVEENCEFGWWAARLYQRIAHYEHEVTDETSIGATRRSLEGLPAIRPSGQTYPSELRAKGRAMLAEGQMPQRIADQLGVNSARTVRSWRKSDKELRNIARKQKRREKAAREALKEQERRETVLAAASPPVAELYSRVRLALEVVDAAILEPSDSRDAASLLRETRSFLYSAESRIVKALGVE